MAKKPELTKKSETEYGCSVCKDWKAILDPKRDVTPEQRRSRVDKYFAEHIKQRHSGEDFSQTAARIVKEATED